jgi:hypothetical protein
MIAMSFLVLIQTTPYGTAMIQMPLPYTDKACEHAGVAASLNAAMTKSEGDRSFMSYTCVPTPTNAANDIKDIKEPTP